MTGMVHMSPFRALALPFDGPFTAQQARLAGISQDSLRHRVAVGEIVRLRRGVFAPAREPTACDRITSAMLTAPPGAVIAGDATASLLGVPVPHSREMRRVDLYVAPGTPPGGGRPEPEVRLHYVDLPLAQRETLRGLTVTSVARTAIDVSRGASFERALIAIDHARRRGVPLRELYDARYAASGLRGIAVLDDALRECDPLAESPLESLSRGVMLRAGVSRPRLQEQVQGRSGEWYRVDFLWPQFRVIGEADGLGKYSGSDSVFDPAQAQRAFAREKRREDDLRAAGFMVVRWTWHQLVQAPSQVMSELRARLR